jgi:primosomal protein N' (replication factor Y)
VARVCRVVPDITAVEREFDYSVPDPLAALVRVGAIVRVPLHGRRVRGWVVADDVASEATTGLLDVLAIVSAGPPADVVALTEWISWRWAGPRVAVLRSASPPNVAPTTVATDSVVTTTEFVPTAGEERVVRTPPLVDRRSQVAAMCAKEGSTIVCVADAGRARGLAAFLEREGRRVALLHSSEPDAQRTAAWARAAGGECVVVGGRIAALAPVPDLRVAVVVDDADEALQEERAPTWHARDVLRERAERAHASFIVCSPAPTPEAVVASRTLVESPPSDVERHGWPRVEVIDRREEPPGAGLLTEPLAVALRNAGGFAVCVLNRRGRFRLLVCAACRHLIRVTANETRPLVCPECGATKLRVLRSGVARVGEELAALLPGKRVVDVDADTTAVPEADIAIGTEAVLHRFDVRRRRPVLVAYLDLDQELLAPRYRAATQAHWLVTRGAQLLAGQPRHDTLLLLQTRLADHVVVEALVAAQPGLVVASEVEYRRELGYPPFGGLAEVTGDEKPLDTAAEIVREHGVAVFGPADGRALVNASDPDLLADALRLAAPAARALGRLRVVVDPARV